MEASGPSPARSGDRSGGGRRRPTATTGDNCGRKRAGAACWKNPREQGAGERRVGRTAERSANGENGAHDRANGLPAAPRAQPDSEATAKRVRADGEGKKAAGHPGAMEKRRERREWRSDRGQPEQRTQATREHAARPACPCACCPCRLLYSISQTLGVCYPFLCNLYG